MNNLSKIITFLMIITAAQFANAQSRGWAPGTPLDVIEFVTCGGLNFFESRDVFDYTFYDQQMPSELSLKIDECKTRKKDAQPRTLKVSKFAAKMKLHKDGSQVTGPVFSTPDHVTRVQLRLRNGANIYILYKINDDGTVEGLLTRRSKSGKVINYGYIFGEASETIEAGVLNN